MLPTFFISLAQSAQPTAQAQGGGGIPPWLWLLIFIVAVIIVWWLLTRSAKEEPPHIEAHHEEPPAEAEEPAPLKAAEPSKPDDLALLEGIGPKVKAVLAEAGIITFAQLAAAEVSRLKEILEAADYPYMDPTSWPEQAKLLAEGNMEAFQELTESLKGGRKV